MKRLAYKAGLLGMREEVRGNVGKKSGGRESLVSQATM